MASAVPEVKISYHADSHGTRGPYGKIHTLHTVYCHGMSTHFLIDVIENSRFKLLELPLRILRAKGVRICNFFLRPIIIGH